MTECNFDTNPPKPEQVPEMPKEIWAWDDGIGSKTSWSGHKGYLGRKNDVKYIRADWIIKELERMAAPYIRRMFDCVEDRDIAYNEAIADVLAILKGDGDE